MKESYDYIGLAMEAEKGAVDEVKPVDKMLVEAESNSCGEVDIEYIAAGAGISVEQAIMELRGEIFQDPSLFANGEKYSIRKHWVLKSVYLGGIITDKLNIATKANRKYNGVFTNNVNALRSVCPRFTDINDIYITIGASWIPPKELERFISKFLRCEYPVEVTYNKELSKYKIKIHPEDAASPLNLSEYGVKGTETIFGKVFEKQYLTAVQIIKDTANGKTVKVFDNVSKGGCVSIINKNKTVEAQEKQMLITEAFRKWVLADNNRKKRFAEYYNNAFARYAFPRYDGRFLKLPGLNPEVKLFDHQRRAVARVLLSGGNVLLAHSVGAGKTYEIIISVHELYRMGLSKKNMVVVPNNLVGYFEKKHRYLYKDDNILVLHTEDFRPAKKEATLNKIKDGDYTAIYVPYRRFDEMVMSKEYYIQKMENEIAKFKAALFSSTDSREKRMLQGHIDTLSKKLVKYMAEATESPWLTFDKLGVNTLVIDEAHNYKNIGISTREGNIIGLDQNGSKKARECVEKAHYVDRVIMATGTPTPNSMMDLFALQTYLQPELLEYHNLSSPDIWLNTFGHKESLVECDIDANSEKFRVITRISSFHNLPELVSLFGQVCDYYEGHGKEEGIPDYDGPINVTIPADDGLLEFMKEISKRTDDVREKRVSRTEDNPLKITVHGRLAGLDLRLLGRYDLWNPYAKGKIDYCADNVVDLYFRYPNTAQVIFCDIGTPKDGFNIYDALADKLVKSGVKREEIAYVHDAVSEKEKLKLYDDINSCKIRVVIGSTQKLGVGVNIQENLIALHHLSVPWRPGDMVQREGRILRKGNKNKKVSIFRYVTEGSFDSYSWQLLESKQRFIASLLSGFCTERYMEDIADTVLSYAEIKALALGDGLIRDRVNTAVALEKAVISSAARQISIQDIRLYIENAPEKIKYYKEIERYSSEDYKYYKSFKTPVAMEERIAFGEELLIALSDNKNFESERYFDNYRGFDIILPSKMIDTNVFVYVKGKSGFKHPCEFVGEKTAYGCTRSIDSVLEHLDKKAEDMKKRAADVKRKAKASKADLERGNPYIEEVERLKSKLAEIDKKLEENEKQREEKKRTKK